MRYTRLQDTEVKGQVNLTRWIQAFEGLRSACLAGLVGLNIDATIISQGKLEWVIQSKGLDELQGVELGMTLVYVSERLD